jgi:hypothetical protein
MGYSNFRKISQVTNKFGLKHEFGILFTKPKPVKPSRWLRETLDIAHDVPLTNEKVKAERLISPVLVEVARAFKPKITLFSGEELVVNPSDDLSGACDFFFALHPPKMEMEAPLISLVEAKDEDMDWGIGQCAAQMYAAKLFNEREGKNIPTIYGCATTGYQWQFLKLDDDKFIVENIVYTDMSQILGVWFQLIERCLTS